jgi:nicotinamidase-related amidase
MIHFSQSAALIIIDVQKAFNNPRWGRRNNPEAEDNIARLLEAWRTTGRPLFHVMHDGIKPTTLFKGEALEFKEQAMPLPGEVVIRKHVNSAFIGTDLEQRLRDAGIEQVVIGGLITNHCVETTTRMAGNLGFDAYLVSDACATFDRTGPDGRLYAAEDIHRFSLANLHDEFATIVDTDTVVEMAVDAMKSE